MQRIPPSITEKKEDPRTLLHGVDTPKQRAKDKPIGNGAGTMVAPPLTGSIPEAGVDRMTRDEQMQRQMAMIFYDIGAKALTHIGEQQMQAEAINKELLQMITESPYVNTTDFVDYYTRTYQRFEAFNKLFQNDDIKEIPIKESEELHKDMLFLRAYYAYAKGGTKGLLRQLGKDRKKAKNSFVNPLVAGAMDAIFSGDAYDEVSNFGFKKDSKIGEPFIGEDDADVMTEEVVEEIKARRKFLEEVAETIGNYKRSKADEEAEEVEDPEILDLLEEEGEDSEDEYADAKDWDEDEMSGDSFGKRKRSMDDEGERSSSKKSAASVKPRFDPRDVEESNNLLLKLVQGKIRRKQRSEKSGKDMDIGMMQSRRRAAPSGGKSRGGTVFGDLSVLDEPPVFDTAPTATGIRTQGQQAPQRSGVRRRVITKPARRESPIVIDEDLKELEDVPEGTKSKSGLLSWAGTAVGFGWLWGTAREADAKKNDADTESQIAEDVSRKTNYSFMQRMRDAHAFATSDRQKQLHAKFKKEAVLVNNIAMVLNVVSMGLQAGVNAYVPPPAAKLKKMTDLLFQKMDISVNSIQDMLVDERMNPVFQAARDAAAAAGSTEDKQEAFSAAVAKILEKDPDMGRTINVWITDMAEDQKENFGVEGNGLLKDLNEALDANGDPEQLRKRMNIFGFAQKILRPDGVKFQRLGKIGAVMRSNINVMKNKVDAMANIAKENLAFKDFNTEIYGANLDEFIQMTKDNSYSWWSDVIPTGGKIFENLGKGAWWDTLTSLKDFAWQVGTNLSMLGLRFTGPVVGTMVVGWQLVKSFFPSAENWTWGRTIITLGILLSVGIGFGATAPAAMMGMVISNSMNAFFWQMGIESARGILDNEGIAFSIVDNFTPMGSLIRWATHDHTGKKRLGVSIANLPLAGASWALSVWRLKEAIAYSIAGIAASPYIAMEGLSNLAIGTFLALWFALLGVAFTVIYKRAHTDASMLEFGIFLASEPQLIFNTLFLPMKIAHSFSLMGWTLVGDVMSDMEIDAFIAQLASVDPALQDPAVIERNMQTGEAVFKGIVGMFQRLPGVAGLEWQDAE